MREDHSFDSLFISLAKPVLPRSRFYRDAGPNITNFASDAALSVLWRQQTTSPMATACSRSRPFSQHATFDTEKQSELLKNWATKESSTPGIPITQQPEDETLSSKSKADRREGGVEKVNEQDTEDLKQREWEIEDNHRTDTASTTTRSTGTGSDKEKDIKKDKPATSSNKVADIGAILINDLM